MASVFSRGKLLVLILLHLTSCFGQIHSSEQSVSYTEPWVNYHVTVPEDTPKGSTLTNITDQGGESNVITSITYQGPQNRFSTKLIPGTHPPLWAVILNTELDYETEKQMILTFVAKGHQGISETPFPFTLHIQDVNDNAPQFKQLPYNAIVNEDEQKGVTVYTTVNATDADSGTNGVISYKGEPVIQGENFSEGSKFIVDPKTGTVTLNGSLDYETTTFYHYRILAQDGGTPSLTSSTDLFITVKDVQDSPPVFVNPPYVQTIGENTRKGNEVLTVKAEDRDRAIPNTVAYNITHSNCGDTFEVDPGTGNISVAVDLDRDDGILKEQNGHCVMTVQATEQDGGNPQKGPFTATAEVSITVQDDNDNAPAFISGHNFLTSIMENSSPGAPLRLKAGDAMTVQDIDQGPNSVISLTVLTSGEVFDLVSPTIQSRGPVQLRVNNSTLLDFETRTEWIVKIRAEDNVHTHNPVTATVTVSVENQNEYSPTFTSQHQTAVSVPENTASGTVVFTAQATDRDAGNLGKITYSLSNSQSIFKIHPDTGKVTLALGSLDREKEVRYFLVVVATDGGGLVNTVPLTITITDINDNAPVFSRDQYELSIDEGATDPSRSVGLQATDLDEPGKPNSRVTFELPHSNWSSYFAVDTNTGSVRLLHPLDYETLPQGGQVALTVKALDHGSPRRTGTAAIIVNVQDVNDNAPVFSHNSQYTVNVTESARPGQAVGQVSAIDGDGSAPNNEVLYLLSGGGGDKFLVNGSTGQVRTTARLDRESAPLYTLTLLAMDKGSPAFTATATLTVHVTNVNDEPPEFQQGQVTVTFQETGSKDSLIYSYTAIDRDENAKLAYAVDWTRSQGRSPAQKAVSGNALKGMLRVTGEKIFTGVHGLDREKVEAITLVFTVKDLNAAPHTAQTATGTVSIQVLDKDDNPPKFNKAAISATIMENPDVGSPLQMNGDLIVTDIDKDQNSAFTLELSDHKECLELVPSTARGEARLGIKVKQPSCFDFEKAHSIVFSVSASGPGPARLKSAAKVTLTVLDVNDNLPRFEEDFYNFTVHSNTTLGMQVATIQATDLDSGSFGRITYSLEGDSAKFDINPNTGVVSTVTSDLTAEGKARYLMTVVATDGAGATMGAHLTVNVLN